MRARGFSSRRPILAYQPALVDLESRIVPTFDGNQIFPLDNPWNQVITNAPVSANSAAIIAHLVSEGNAGVHPDFGNPVTDGALYGIPVNVVDNTVPPVPVIIPPDGYGDESDNEPVPIPANAVIEGDGPTGPASPVGRGDSHLIVYDKSTNVVYEMYLAARPTETTFPSYDVNTPGPAHQTGSWGAYSLSVWDLNQDTFRTIGWTSADAAGLPIMPGLVRPDEALPTSEGGQGAIDHAIRMTVEETQDMFVYPASHEASDETDSDLPRMGDRFRLNASFQIPDDWAPEVKAVAQAMKDYGLIVADNGSNMYFQGTPSSLWDMDSMLQLQSAIHASDFEVVDLTPIVTGLNVAAGSPSGGTTLTITGQNFSGASGNLHVLFGGTEATSFTIVSDTQITVTTPAHAAGLVDVQVQSGSDQTDSDGNSVFFGYGTSATSTADQFTFTNTVPPSSPPGVPPTPPVAPPSPPVAPPTPPVVPPTPPVVPPTPPVVPPTPPTVPPSPPAVPPSPPTAPPVVPPVAPPVVPPAIPPIVPPVVSPSPPLVPPPPSPPGVPPPPLSPPGVPPPPSSPPGVPPASPSPVLIGTSQYAVGSDAGGNGIVTLYNADQSVALTADPFPGFTGGVRVAAADFNSDGTDDIVAGTGPGGPSHVEIIDGKTGQVLFSVDPFEASFTGGVFVAAGDLNGDGVPDLIVTPDQGGGPRVRVFDGKTFGLMADFFGIDDTGFRGGARAAVGDLTGAGYGDLIVSAGFGGGPRIAGYDGKSLATGNPVKLFADFYAFEPTLSNGAYVAVGDVNGDGHADIIAGGGPGGGPRVTVFDGASLLANTKTVVADFFAGDPSNRGGIRVAVKNLDGSDQASLVVGAGTGAGSAITTYTGAAIMAAPSSPAALYTFDAQPGFAGGVFVG
ncbi:IPT/TIG domain-containing protein [Fimbriiglobus ruber]|uniref:IPT/TIG domain-containing protein n=1 Tax=Fimbriiglobus ruber TaxID=1908690 RepID=A0A225DYS2_9BACT|nr:IPT/TIG domain-containing protein [Fimbriiglobus ruber]OWK46680.1 hypothetical protein FRUB_00379 [Fimbriiglobus ruber]